MPILTFLVILFGLILVNKWYFWGYLKLSDHGKALIPPTPHNPVSVLDNIKGKNVEIKVRELSSFYGKVVGFDGVFVVIESTRTNNGKTVTKTYYIPVYNIIYITPT